MPVKDLSATPFARRSLRRGLVAGLGERFHHLRVAVDLAFESRHALFEREDPGIVQGRLAGPWPGNAREGKASVGTQPRRTA